MGHGSEVREVFVQRLRRHPDQKPLPLSRDPAQGLALLDGSSETAEQGVAGKLELPGQNTERGRTRQLDELPNCKNP